MDQYNRIEAISAVADDAFLVEEDDDYEDLYNDVNIGEGFLQSTRKNDEAGLRNEEQKKVSSETSKENVEPAPKTPERQILIPDVVTGGIEAQGFTGSGVPGGSVSETGAGLRVELEQASSRENAVEIPVVNNNNSSQGLLPSQHINEPMIRPGVSNVNSVTASGSGTVGNGGVATGGGTMLFVGDLQWWTTDAELEAELCKYGTVKEVKFFDEKATGKSKGYCQVEFYDSTAATACKEGLDGHMFNGKPCVVAFASPYNVKRMGEAQVNKKMGEIQSILAQAKKGAPIDPPNKPPATNNINAGGNHQGGEGRGFGRGNWGRGNAQGMVGRGQVGPVRNRPGGMGVRGLMGNGGGGFNPMMHPQAMMGQGFDPAFGGPMARMGNYGGGFPGAPGPPFMPSFPHVGLPGVAPHVNPAFFGRGMPPMNGMGMMPPNMGVDRGPNMGMWDPNTGGWGGNRAAESSYGEEARSDHQYGEDATSDHQYDEEVHNKDRGSRLKEKDRAPEREWSASSDRRNRDEKDAGHERDMTREKDVSHSRDWPERRHRDDRDGGRERERERHNDRERSRGRDREREKDRDHHREERERYGDHRSRLKDEPERDKEWDSGRSSRAPSKSRLHREDNHRSRSKEADYGKRRRLTSD